MEPRDQLPIALIGIMGSGKSATAVVLAQRLGISAVDLDREIEKNGGRTVATIFAERGEGAFRDLEVETLRAVLALGPGVIACGGGVVLRAESRALLRDRCRSVWLEADPATAAARFATDDTARPLLAGAAPEVRLAEILAERRAWYAEVALGRVATDGLSPAEVADGVIAVLAAPQGLKTRRGDG